MAAGLVCSGACQTGAGAVLGGDPQGDPAGAKAPAPGGAGDPGVLGTKVLCDTAFDRTGSLRSDGAFVSMLTNKYVYAGDEGNTNLAQRAIVSVVLNQIPAGANIVNATLRINGLAPEGDPFGEFGPMTVDHVNVVSSISAVNFLGKTLTSSIATVPSLPYGVKQQQTLELDVTAQVKADIAAGRPISSFRFQFVNAPSLNGVFDQAAIMADQNDDNDRPIVTVTTNP